jgi:hypothetical protein
MENEMNCQNEVVTDYDERIARLEADILESKALLSSLSTDDFLFFE